jgi:restriction system protein
MYGANGMGAEQKERYVAEREAETSRRNKVIDRKLADLDDILSVGISPNLVIDYNARKLPPPAFDAGELDIPYQEPTLEDFLPFEPGTLARMIPGWQARYDMKYVRAQEEFQAAHAEWKRREKERKKQAKQLADRDKRYQHALSDMQTQHLRMDELAADAATGKQYAVEDYVRYALETSSYPRGFVVKVGLRYLPSRQNLLIECEFPLARDIIPTEVGWRYIKTRDAIEPKPRSATDADKIYKSVLAQVTLRTIYEIFTIDAFGHIEVVNFKGVVNDVDPSTGRATQYLLVSLRADREEFLDRDFSSSRLNPIKVLQSLRANFSSAPTELQPIAAVVEFDVNDPRFIEEQDIISSLNEATNLVDLTPGAFEHLITNLFKKMGFEAYPTQRSKDGGVDCIAYYKEPVVGGKYVIQAKRWTHTVQVDAVRDLFGAMDHERANKGILVTTSKFAPACYKFAEGKPLQLLDGSNLLALIEKHTDLKVRIVMPPRKS